MIAILLFFVFTFVVAAYIISVELKLWPATTKAEKRARISQLIYNMAFGAAVATPVLGSSLVLRDSHLLPTWRDLAPFFTMALGIWLVGLIVRFILRIKTHEASK